MKERLLRGRFDQDDWYDQRDAYKAVLDAPVPTAELSEIMDAERENFHDMLFRLIEERGLTDPQVSHGALMTRQHFGKIRQNKDYRPKKKAVLALAVALQLNTAETEALLAKAGHVLSDCDSCDLVMRYCLNRKIYDFRDIDSFLKHFGLYDEVFRKKKTNKKKKTDNAKRK